MTGGDTIAIKSLERPLETRDALDCPVSGKRAYNIRWNPPCPLGNDILRSTDHASSTAATNASCPSSTPTLKNSSASGIACSGRPISTATNRGNRVLLCKLLVQTINRSIALLIVVIATDLSFNGLKGRWFRRNVVVNNYELKVEQSLRAPFPTLRIRPPQLEPYSCASLNPAPIEKKCGVPIEVKVLFTTRCLDTQ